MSTKSLLVSMMTFMCVSVYADKSFTFGGGFFPSQDIKISGSDGKYTYSYKPLFGFNVGWNYSHNVLSTLGELTFTNAKFDHWTGQGSATATFNPADYKEENLTDISLAYYVGGTINRMGRLQIPLYAGVGCSLLAGDPFTTVDFFIGVKARLKYFVSDNVGIFAGVDLRRGKKLKDFKDDDLSARRFTPNIEFGVVFVPKQKSK